MAEHNLLNNHIEMALLDTISDLIRVVDEDNQVVYYNHAMRLALEDQMYHVCMIRTITASSTFA